MSMNRRTTLALMGGAASAALALKAPRPASAATPSDTLILVNEMGPNSLETMLPAANDQARMVAWSVYDRLVTHGTKTLPNGALGYDATKFEPELAESWEVVDDGKTMVFKIRKDATFHDGSPVTAEDVRWSFERAIAAGGFPAVQMAAGSLTDAKQFTAVDDHTFKITFDKANKLSLPDLAVPVPCVVNKKLALQHATSADPYAIEWTQRNDAGGGAFKVQSWKPGDQLILDPLRRVEVGAPPPAQEGRVPPDRLAGHPPRAAREGRRRHLGRPAAQGLRRTGRGREAQGDRHAGPGRPAVPRHEREDRTLRQSQGPAGGRLGHPLQGDHGRGALQPRHRHVRRRPRHHHLPADVAHPSPFSTDLDKAKALLAEAGLQNGFETTLSFDLSQATTREPIALLVQESLGKLGIKVTDREGARRQLVRQHGVQEDAVRDPEFYAVAGLSRVPLLLDLPRRQQLGVQHLQLRQPEAGRS